MQVCCEQRFAAGMRHCFCSFQKLGHCTVLLILVTYRGHPSDCALVGQAVVLAEVPLVNDRDVSGPCGLPSQL